MDIECMLAKIQNHAARIVMGAAFYLFGFFVVANALELGDRDIVVGLVAGLVGGVTMLAAVMSEGRDRLDYCSGSSAP
jgi:hypothetical protein